MTMQIYSYKYNVSARDEPTAVRMEAVREAMTRGIETTRALFDRDDDELFSAALAASERAALRAGGSGSVKASPLILTGDCRTRPVCRHCKWEHFKAESYDSFVLDRPISEIVDHAHYLADLGIDRAFVATGWMGYRLPREYLSAVEAIHGAEPRLTLYGLFGALDRQSHFDLASAGLSGMLTSLESPSEAVYRSFRPGGDSLTDRLRALEHTREAGLSVWTGFLVGLGETEDDVAWGIEAIARFEPESVSILPFVPFPDTPMEGHPAADPLWLARVNAAARVRVDSAAYFFSDHDHEFDRLYAERIGINGSYETGIAPRTRS